MDLLSAYLIFQTPIIIAILIVIGIIFYLCYKKDTRNIQEEQDRARLPGSRALSPAYVDVDLSGRPPTYAQTMEMESPPSYAQAIEMDSLGTQEEPSSVVVISSPENNRGI